MLLLTVSVIDMGKLLKKIIRMILLFISMTFLNFMILYLAPGSPIDAIINPRATKEVLEEKEKALGLKEPLVIQYFKWFGKVLKGDFGKSFSSYEDVSLIIKKTFSRSILLTGSGFLIGLCLSLVLGTYSMYNKDGLFGKIVEKLSLLFLSVPTFVMGLILIYIFGLKLKILPVSGFRDLAGGGGFSDTLRHLIMPASVLGIAMAGRNIRYVRESLKECEEQPYVLTPRAKGMKRSFILFRHELRNALIPIITNLSMELPILVSGALVTEKVFSYPGLGFLMLDSVARRDYPVIMAINLLICAVVILSGFFLDISYLFLDKRIERDKI